MPQVTVVPADRLIIVNGTALVFPYVAPENLHALQWNEKAGHTEWTDGPNQPLEAKDYDKHVAPYVTLWQAEKDRREKEAAEEAAARRDELLAAVEDAGTVDAVRAVVVDYDV